VVQILTSRFQFKYISTEGYQEMGLSDTTNASEFIDRRSYILGMITAFAECVTNECKKIAFF